MLCRGQILWPLWVSLGCSWWIIEKVESVTRQTHTQALPRIRTPVNVPDQEAVQVAVHPIQLLLVFLSGASTDHMNDIDIYSL